MKQEPGKWKPYNVKSIVANVESVFKRKNIHYLNEVAYNFIIMQMGFIAHYDLSGFQGAYSDLREFAKALLTSEYSNNEEYNLQKAIRQETDDDFRKWYGEAYNKSIADAIRGIVAVVKSYEVEINKSFTEQEKQHDIACAKALLTKWGYELAMIKEVK